MPAVTLQYWDLLAKGYAPAIALNVAGAEWELESPGFGDWGSLKWRTTWGFMPNMKLEDGSAVGSELAILQYLARKYPQLAGETDADFVNSQNLLGQAEELWSKLAAHSASPMAADKSVEAFDAWVAGNAKDTHSAKQGLQVYLWQFEDYYGKNGGSDGKFTTSGLSIGEIKLFSVLAALLSVVPGALDKYTNVKAFYTRVGADPRVAAVAQGKAANMSKPFSTYLRAPTV